MTAEWSRQTRQGYTFRTLSDPASRSTSDWVELQKTQSIQHHSKGTQSRCNTYATIKSNCCELDVLQKYPELVPKLHEDFQRTACTKYERWLKDRHKADEQKTTSGSQISCHNWLSSKQLGRLRDRRIELLPNHLRLHRRRSTCQSTGIERLTCLRLRCWCSKSRGRRTLRHTSRHATRHSTLLLHH